jgi:hypothetical protein
MPYIPKAHEKYNLLTINEQFNSEVFEYDADTVWEVLHIIGKDYNLMPYNYPSYESYFEELDKLASEFSDNHDAVNAIEKLRNEIKELNQKEEWSVLKYIGPTTEEIGLTNGKNYYWPTSKNNPVYNGVFDDEEIRSYLYPTDEKFWIILEDPTGMAYNTIYGNGRKLLEEDYNRMLEEEGWIHFKGE